MQSMLTMMQCCKTCPYWYLILVGQIFPGKKSKWHMLKPCFPLWCDIELIEPWWVRLKWKTITSWFRVSSVSWGIMVNTNTWGSYADGSLNIAALNPHAVGTSRLKSVPTSNWISSIFQCSADCCASANTYDKTGHAMLAAGSNGRQTVSHAGCRAQCVTNGIVMNARALRIIAQMVELMADKSKNGNPVERMLLT